MNDTQTNQTPEVAAPVVELPDSEMKESLSIESKSEVVDSKEPEKIQIPKPLTPVIISLTTPNKQTSKPSTNSAEKSAISGAHFTP